MAKNVNTPPELRIAALEQQKQLEAITNLMTPGDGTPWEQRGSGGVVGGFFKTAIQSMLNPSKLLWSIRRPETTADATGFLLLCGAFWGIGWVVHDFLYKLWSVEPRVNSIEFTGHYDESIYFLGMMLAALLCPLWAILAVKFQIPLFRKLLAMEFERTRTKPDVTLFYNVLAYLQGPAVLSILPVVGPPLAVGWIFVNTSVAMIKRMRTTVAGSIIAVILTGLATIAVAVGVGVVLDFLWYQLPTGGAIQKNPWGDNNYQ